MGHIMSYNKSYGCAQLYVTCNLSLTFSPWVWAIFLNNTEHPSSDVHTYVPCKIAKAVFDTCGLSREKEKQFSGQTGQTKEKQIEFPCFKSSCLIVKAKVTIHGNQRKIIANPSWISYYPIRWFAYTFHCTSISGFVALSFIRFHTITHRKSISGFSAVPFQ